MPSSFTALHEYSEKQQAVLFVLLTLFFVLCGCLLFVPVRHVLNCEVA